MEPSQSDIWKAVKLVATGKTLCQHESGKLAFAYGPLPEESIVAQEVALQHQTLHIVRWELLQASQERRIAACPYYESCGGCDWMHINEAAQSRFKREMLTDALKRITKIDVPPGTITFYASPKALAYRNRLKLHIDNKGRWGLRAHRSHDLIEISNCLISNAKINEVITTLRKLGSVPPFFSSCSQMEIRASSTQSSALVVFYPKKHAKKQKLEQLYASLEGKLALSIAGHPELGPSIQGWNNGSLELEIPVTAFVQVNDDINELMVERVIQGAKQRKLHSVCDAFCGAGNFILPLVKAGLTGLGIESHPQAIQSAKATSQRLGYEQQVDFIASDAQTALQELNQRKQSYDLVILDPPRRGAKNLVDYAAKATRSHLLFCACDPVSLARDLKAFLERGFALEHIELFDLFAQTHHFESIVWLKKAHNVASLP
ncbi:MAG: class I SAM-dependent RNA methyltransferase [Myxococcales bacterium]|nr:MAG: class I SAM-dependent RNA methyltransferase [Myxococcales bacterium]